MMLELLSRESEARWLLASQQHRDATALQHALAMQAITAPQSPTKSPTAEWGRSLPTSPRAQAAPAMFDAAEVERHGLRRLRVKAGTTGTFVVMVNTAFTTALQRAAAEGRPKAGAVRCICVAEAFQTSLIVSPELLAEILAATAAPGREAVPSVPAVAQTVGVRKDSLNFAPLPIAQFLTRWIAGEGPSVMIVES
jgi:hypothetical protein